MREAAGTAAAALSADQIARDLRPHLAGTVLPELHNRAVYATNAAYHEILPLCIVQPKTAEDVRTVVRYASERGVPIVPRGFGSGLADAAVGSGIVLDFSRYMTAIHSVDSSAGRVVVEPGVTRSALNRAVEPFGKHLPPDPSSTEYCCIGGMIGTDATGAHMTKYGRMRDYIESLRVVLSNGELVEFRRLPVSSPEIAEKRRAPTLEGALYRELPTLLEGHHEAILKAQPKVKKNNAGYRLDRVLSEGSFDLCQLLAGSEGTLGIVVEAALRIIDLPAHRGVGILHFASVEQAGAAVHEVLRLGPASVELLDRTLLELARPSRPDFERLVPAGVVAVLLVEFDGPTRDSVRRSLEEVRSRLQDELHLCLQARFSDDPVEMEQLWAVRKMAVPILNKIQGRRKPIPVIEDAAVPPEQLAAYIHELEALAARHGIRLALYGHAAEGALHTRPLLDLKDEQDLRTMAELAEEVFRILQGFGGSVSSEHGDGLTRSGFLRRLYGEEVYGLFADVKHLFDPSGLLNPGKKLCEADGLTLLDLRYGPHYRRRAWAPLLHWGGRGDAVYSGMTGHSEELSWEDEIELCHGCGECRSSSPSTRDCPVFRASGDEMTSPRGRNNLLRWLLKEGGLDPAFAGSAEYAHIIYSYCVQCKACILDCPSNVNTAKMMLEARAQYVALRGVPRELRFFLNYERNIRLASAVAPVANWALKRRWLRRLGEPLTGIHRDRNIPPFVLQTFARWFRTHRARNLPEPGAPEAVYFYDTYANYNNPRVGRAVVRLLEANGFAVIVPPQRFSGLPALSAGALERAREYAAYNIAQLAPYARRGVPIVCSSPAASLALKSEYLSLFDTPDAHAVAEATSDIHEFLWRLHRRGQLRTTFRPVPQRLAVNVHCHARAQRLEPAILGLLRLIPRTEAMQLQAGCCGVGGDFGFLVSHFADSMRMGQPLFRAAAERRAAGWRIVTDGEACKMQLELGAKLDDIELPICLLAEAAGLSL